jgi:hypothetical protein
MTTAKPQAVEIAEVNLTETDEDLESGWFARERVTRTSVAPRASRATLPPPRPSVPPIGDADVDSWLR